MTWISCVPGARVTVGGASIRTPLHADRMMASGQNLRSRGLLDLSLPRQEERDPLHRTAQASSPRGLPGLVIAAQHEAEGPKATPLPWRGTPLAQHTTTSPCQRRRWSSTRAWVEMTCFRLWRTNCTTTTYAEGTRPLGPRPAARASRLLPPPPIPPPLRRLQLLLILLRLGLLLLGLLRLLPPPLPPEPPSRPGRVEPEFLVCREMMATKPLQEVIIRRRR